jgi:hypothetical protein
MQQSRRASIVPVFAAQQSVAAPRFTEAELATFSEVFSLFAASPAGEVPLAGTCSLFYDADFKHGHLKRIRHQPMSCATRELQTAQTLAPWCAPLNSR